MFCILPCALVKDKVNLSPVGEAAGLIPEMDQVRNDIRRLSDTDHLIKVLGQGEVMMTRKVQFDNYLQSQVDLMRSYVSTYTPCNFYYACFFTGGEIDTSGLQMKDQWAVEIVLSRLNISSIYHAGAFNNMRVIFMETPKSYQGGFKASSDLVSNLKIAYQYFNEGYQPLRRLLPHFQAVEDLASGPTRQKYAELNRNMFDIYTQMVTLNLAYLKIEKLRLLSEFKSAKEAAYAAYLRTVDCKTRLNGLRGSYPSLLKEMGDFFDLAELFYQVLAFYLMLIQHEQAKTTHEYGFIKKEFQQMIMDNLVAIEEIERLMATRPGSLNGQNDNVMFGLGILKAVAEDTRKIKYRYNINIHENKAQRPSLQEVVSSRIGASNIWETLEFF